LAPVQVSPPQVVHVRMIREVHHWEHLRPQWDQLFDASPTASPPLRFEWLRTWWDIYGSTYADGGRGLRIFTVWRNRTLIGALPLYEGIRHGSGCGVRRLGFISSSEAEFEETCADYLDLLHLPDDAETCVRALAPALLNRRFTHWHELVLDRISAGSPLLALRQHLERAVKTSVTDRGLCYLSDIRGGLDAYLSRLNAKVRKDTKRSLRLASEAAAVFEIAQDACQIDDFFDELVMLHQRRWQAAGKPGCFSSPRFTEFHRRMLQAWVPKGIGVVARLSCHNVPVAVFQGVIARKKFDGYIYGVLRDEGSPLIGPGNAMLVLLKSYLGDLGVETMDTLLSKPNSHKRRHSTGSNTLVRLTATRPGARIFLESCLQQSHRAIRATRRVLARRQPSKPVAFDTAS
jgi:CelD/BcsL family acetyltransferase involved in cellulose biosynthesis